jgi:hypothetical protein
MTTIPATTFSQQLFERGTVRGNSGLNRGLAFAAALYLAVAIVEHFRDWLVVRSNIIYHRE